eukprot:312692-Prymnesium_polylepis.1
MSLEVQQQVHGGRSGCDSCGGNDGCGPRPQPITPVAGGTWPKVARGQMWHVAEGGTWPKVCGGAT